jgi:MtN3 and saliva related transmembrane protein
LGAAFRAIVAIVISANTDSVERLFTPIAALRRTGQQIQGLGHFFSPSEDRTAPDFSNDSFRRRTAGNDPRQAALLRMDWATVVGSVAAFFTTLSYAPQLYKCWQTGSAGDLSLKMFGILATGVALWTVYGFLKSDYVIIAANAVSLVLLAGILFFKLRETTRP